MGRECQVSGKKTSFGNHKTERGKAKYLGGVGKKTTGSKPPHVQAEPPVDSRVAAQWHDMPCPRGHVGDSHWPAYP